MIFLIRDLELDEPGTQGSTVIPKPRAAAKVFEISGKKKKKNSKNRDLQKKKKKNAAAGAKERKRTIW